jgi:V-type H+-transporting ATPase subunit a
VYHVLNMFQVDLGRKVLMGEMWVPTRRCEELVSFVRAREGDAAVKTVLDLEEVSSEEDSHGEGEAAEDKSGDIGRGVPPTLMHTNRFTKAFNSVIDAYATATYGEVNPAVFAIATFPFLFGIMFGDVGHGLLLLLGALAMLAFERRLLRLHKDELGQFGTIFRARYLVLLMAICSIYCGFLYNEFFAIPMNLQYTQWSPNPPSHYWVKGNATFPFGVDPIWKMAENELLMYNSFKMKMSIIVAYLHMMLGLVLMAFNAVHFKRPYDLYYEFIPRAIFLTCIIGYMVLLIFWKWLTPWSSVQPFPPNQIGNGASAAPFIISIMTNFFLKPLDTATNIECLHMLGCPLQSIVQFLLLLIAVVCVPVMLLVKPLLLRRDARRRGDDTFQFGDVMIHSVIETIEFVLGTISNTASYLRLWALSLAHAELSVVFYEKILVTGMRIAAQQPGAAGVVLLFATWAAWAAFTLGVLIAMEGLSAFLHTLRLHWVEFMSKHYAGNGLKFKAFSFATLHEELAQAAVEDV